jgi:hypothetical protein
MVDEVEDYQIGVEDKSVDMIGIIEVLRLRTNQERFHSYQLNLIFMNIGTKTINS